MLIDELVAHIDPHQYSLLSPVAKALPVGNAVKVVVMVLSVPVGTFNLIMLKPVLCGALE